MKFVGTCFCAVFISPRIWTNCRRLWVW